MFSDHDFMDYFRQLAELEEKMLADAEKACSLVTDPTCLHTLHYIRDEEARHLGQMNSIIEIIRNAARDPKA